jgi:NADPH:quinone reductase-like Zn-dependent oxidoreductase
MKAAQFDRYGPAREVLRIIDVASVPEPGPGELLVRVRASSVNPIDCAVRSGYGHAFFESRTHTRPPMMPGRDVAGEIVAIGPRIDERPQDKRSSRTDVAPTDVADSFQVGDPVYAATMGGANAEYAVVPEPWAAPKPAALSFEEAAALPYVALTAWTALCTHAGLSAGNAQQKRVVVPRAAGGVGSFAVQLAKAWGGYVAALCSTRNVSLVEGLGPDLVIDHTRSEPRALLHDFDIAFDTSFDTEQMLLDSLKMHADAAYVSIVSPRLRLVDEYGLEEGVRRGDDLFAERAAAQKALGRRYYWSFAAPSGAALRTIGALVEAGRIRPVIDRTYPLERIVEAHEYSESGAAQGKIVIHIPAS